jgi:predicted MPP superfamily phosphohydrolase
MLDTVAAHVTVADTVAVTATATGKLIMPQHPSPLFVQSGVGKLSAKFPKLTRRRLLGAAVAAVPAACFLDAFCFEPKNLKVRSLELSESPEVRLVHFTDFHHDGDRDFAQEMVDAVNLSGASAACFSGDIVSDSAHFNEALDFIRKIEMPVYGVPGNHDEARKKRYPQIRSAFEATGGAWLEDREIKLPGSAVVLAGAVGDTASFLSPESPGKRILMVHYPDFVERLGNREVSLILAGHSHGGQIRLPLVGPLVLPNRVGAYDRGLYQTKAGPLHVSVGIGTFGYKARFFCRPEVVVIDI